MTYYILAMFIAFVVLTVFAVLQIAVAFDLLNRRVKRLEEDHD